MDPRPVTRRGVVWVVLTAFALLFSGVSGWENRWSRVAGGPAVSVAQADGGAVEVGSVRGGGFSLDRALCILCVSTLVGIGGTSLFGMVFAASLYVDFAVTCGFQCAAAFF